MSPGFVLAGHSSPSFGSQRVRSRCASSRNENETPRECGRVSQWNLETKKTLRLFLHLPSIPKQGIFTFILPLGFVRTQWLAHMLDSWVRGSRRVGWSIKRNATDRRGYALSKEHHTNSEEGPRPDIVQPLAHRQHLRRSGKQKKLRANSFFYTVERQPGHWGFATGTVPRQTDPQAVDRHPTSRGVLKQRSAGSPHGTVPTQESHTQKECKDQPE